MAYDPQTWTDGEVGGTPISAARLNIMEQGIADAQNSTDAELRARATHTGTQTSATISDFTEAVQDAVAALLGAGSNVTVAYNDAANTLTVSSSGGGVTDPEAVRDAIGVALVGVGPISIAVNDAADTITISTTATQNSTDAALRDRSTHTGTQAQSTVTNLAADLAAKATTTHTHTASQVTDSTTLGRSLLTAATVTAAREAQNIYVIANGASTAGFPDGSIIYELDA